MKIELMRKMDYWLGIPLCFLLSIVHWFLKPFVLRKTKFTIHPKILFIKLSEMGSILLAYPLFDRALKEYPKENIFFLTFYKNKPLFEILNIVPHRNILTIRENSALHFLMDTIKAIRKIRGEKIGVVFDLEFFSRFSAIIVYLSGSSKRAGFYNYKGEGLYRGNFLTHKVQYNPTLHISKLYLSFWQAAKAETKFTPELEERVEDGDIFLPRLNLIDGVKDGIWSDLKRFGIEQGNRIILINPGEGHIPQRDWHLDNFITLSKKLLEDDRNHLIIVGIDGVSKKAKRILDLVGNRRLIDLTNKTTLSEILELFNIGSALIANDCGLAHIASLAPIKKFILFGPESPKIYAPLGENTWIIYSDLPCSPCLSVFNNRNSTCLDNKCLKKITPDEVYELIKANP